MRKQHITLDDIVKKKHTHEGLNRDTSKIKEPPDIHSNARYYDTIKTVKKREGRTWSLCFHSQGWATFI